MEKVLAPICFSIRTFKVLVRPSLARPTLTPERWCNRRDKRTAVRRAKPSERSYSRGDRAAALQAENRRAARGWAEPTGGTPDAAAFRPGAAQGWGLLADLETSDDVQIPLRSDPLQVIEQPAAPTDHHQQTSPTGVVLGVRTQMFGELANSRSQQRDLDLGTSGVRVAAAEIPNDCSFSLFSNRHLRPHFPRVGRPHTRGEAATPILKVVLGLFPHVWLPNDLST